MRHPGRPSSALAVTACGIALAFVVAACGGSASPSPAASGAPAASQDAGAGAQAPTPAPSAEPSAAASQAAGGGTTAGCADPAKLASAMQGADHYVATATIDAAIPEGSAASGLAVEMKMEFAKPDRIRVSAGMAGTPGALFEMVSVGKDSWIRMFGGDSWVKSDATETPSASSNPDVFGSTFDSSGLTALDKLPDGLDLPGSSSCVVAYTITAPPAVIGGDGSPLGALGSAMGFAARVDTSTGRPQSMGFLVDPAKATLGGPTAIVFTFDYDTAVDISAPDPSKVGTGGGFPLPSGLVLPSGLKLP
jgi:hypothetical protein